MKFTMNGALTIGTLDGANVEIREAVGDDNFFLFGLTADEVERVKRDGYRPGLRARNDELREALDLIADGHFSRGDRDMFRPLVENSAASPIRSSCWPTSPPTSRPAARQRRVAGPAALDSHVDPQRRALAGKFSSDRAIGEYCERDLEDRPVRIALDRALTPEPAPRLCGAATGHDFRRVRPSCPKASTFASSAAVPLSSNFSFMPPRRTAPEPFQIIRTHCPNATARSFSGMCWSKIFRCRATITWSSACRWARAIHGVPHGPDDIERTGRAFYPRNELLDPSCACRQRPSCWHRKPAPAAPFEPGHASLRAIVTEPLDEREDVAVSYARRCRYLRTACRRLHARSIERRSTSRHVRGADRKDPLSEGARRHARRTAAGDGLRRAGRSRIRRGAWARNYWGYSTHSFYSPHPRYCVEPARRRRNSARSIDAMHAAGIRVLLDVVFNHTSEAGMNGPVINFKVLANDIFYQVDRDVHATIAITPAAATRSTAIIRWCRRSSCVASNIG